MFLLEQLFTSTINWLALEYNYNWSLFPQWYIEKYFEDLFGIKIPEFKTIEEKEWKTIKLKAFMQTEYFYYLDQYKKGMYGPSLDLTREIIYFDYLQECRDMTKKDFMLKYSLDNKLISIVKAKEELPKSFLDLLKNESEVLKNNEKNLIKFKKVTGINDWYLHGFYKFYKN